MPMPRPNLENIIASLKIAIENSNSIEAINALRKEFLGNSSLISKERKNLSQLSDLDKKKYGPEIKQVTENIQSYITRAVENEKKTLNCY